MALVYPAATVPKGPSVWRSALWSLTGTALRVRVSAVHHAEVGALYATVQRPSRPHTQHAAQQADNTEASAKSINRGYLEGLKSHGTTASLHTNRGHLLPQSTIDVPSATMVTHPTCLWMAPFFRATLSAPLCTRRLMRGAHHWEQVRAFSMRPPELSAWEQDEMLDRILAVNNKLDLVLHDDCSLRKAQDIINQADRDACNFWTLDYSLRIARRAKDATMRQRLRFVVRALQLARENSVAATSFTLSHILALAMPSRKVNLALVVRDMCNEVLDARAYGGLIALFSTCKRPKLMEEAFVDLLRIYRTADADVFRFMMMGYLACKDARNSMSTWKLMRSPRFASTVQIDQRALELGARVAALANDIDEATWIEKKWVELKQQPLDRLHEIRAVAVSPSRLDPSAARRNLHPDTRMLNEQLQVAHDENADLPRVRQLLESAALAPLNTMSLILLFRLFRSMPAMNVMLRHQRLACAVRVLQRARRDGVIFDSYRIMHLTPLAVSLGKVNVLLAVKHIIQHQHHQQLNLLAYKALISHFRSCWRPQLMLDVFYELLQVHGVADADAFTRVLNGLLEERNFDAAWEVWKVLRTPPHSDPGLVEITPTLLDTGAWILSRRLDAGEDVKWIVRKYEELGITPTARKVDLLTTAAIRAGLFHDARELMRWSIRCQYVVHERSLNLFLSECVSSKQSEELLSLSRVLMDAERLCSTDEDRTAFLHRYAHVLDEVVEHRKLDPIAASESLQRLFLRWQVSDHLPMAHSIQQVASRIRDRGRKRQRAHEPDI
ncbi:hypothetical protein FVE85_1226 [Porphyridium purpureum]|uniref:Uncharacterized protein n=1 Tax=Porphyridium purpureum TaxID=35688 RepID=A0A5J4YGK6_PORPP|nr:hypothetical protein FVE85_1226 [Porphyridium purpureum]|eukprot:POR2494..scf218_34